MWDAAYRATKQAQEATKEYRDSAKPFLLMLQVNDKVLMRKEKPGNKLAYRWTGPYRVQMVLPRDNYLLTDLKDQRATERVHISRLRRYRAREKRETSAEESGGEDKEDSEEDDPHVEKDRGLKWIGPTCDRCFPLGISQG